MKKFYAFLFLLFPSLGFSCTIQYQINLETFGEGVLVELRKGIPGSSKIIDVRRSTGGSVLFNKLCQGSYFVAIGSGDSVDVTPTKNFVEQVKYTSNITVQRGTGNMSKKSRNAL
jgi:hypothetical protein